MTLNEHLIAHFKQNRGIWLKKGSLYALSDDWGYSPESLGRELRSLSEDPTSHVTVEYYKGQRNQKLARYCYDAPVEKKMKIIIKDNIAYQIYD